jgi:hypothetical protein
LEDAKWSNEEKYAGTTYIFKDPDYHRENEKYVSLFWSHHTTTAGGFYHRSRSMSQ